MAIRLSTSLLLPAALGAAAIAFLLSDRAPAASVAPSDTASPVAALEQATQSAPGPLPPNHPPIGTASPHGGRAGQPEPAALTWEAPAQWKTIPSTSAMRLATYQVGEGAELAVVRAGGSTEANVQRWLGQFDAPATSDRTEKTLHGMKVTRVRIAGTYGGGMGAAAAAPKPGWVMLAAIVEPAGTPYFFKLIGPAEQVDAATALFDRMIDGVAPAAAK
jgi:hypothetical protein